MVQYTSYTITLARKCMCDGTVQCCTVVGGGDPFVVVATVSSSVFVVIELLFVCGNVMTCTTRTYNSYERIKSPSQLAPPLRYHRSRVPSVALVCRRRVVAAVGRVDISP